MNSKEIAEFWELCFIHFPSLEDWINKKSPNPAHTIAVWSKAWETITVQEAMSVLNRWTTGELEPPVGYQREIFHLHLRAVVMQERSERAGQRLAQEAIAKANVGAKKPPILFSCREVYNRVKCEVDKFNAGVITRGEMVATTQSIVREACAKVDAQGSGRQDVDHIRSARHSSSETETAFFD